MSGTDVQQLYDSARTDLRLLRHLVNGAAKQDIGAFENHPLGFIHIDLTDVTADSSLALHVWSGTTFTAVHDHFFDLTSCVLTGCIEDVWCEALEDLSGRYVRFSVEYDWRKAERRFRPAPPNVSYTIRESTRTERVQEEYRIPKRQLHKSRRLGAVSGCAMTLMMRANSGPTSERISYTLSADLKFEARVAERAMSDTGRRRVLSFIHAQLDAI